MLYKFYFHILACEGNLKSLGGLCCEANQVNDNGECAQECSDDRPVEKDGVCGCAADLIDLGYGLCCSADKVDNKGQCIQQLQREESVKEFCIVNENQGFSKMKSILD